MRLNDLMSYKHRDKLGVAIIIIAILGVAYFGGFGTQSAFDGSITTITTAGGDSVNSGDTISEASGLYLWVRDVDASGFDCNLYISADNTLVSGGVDTKDGYDVTWTFDLSNVYKGTHMYYLATTEDAPWISYTFYIIGDDNSPDFIVTSPPELTFYPQDESILAGDTSTLRWKVIYVESAVVEIYLDEVLVDTMSHAGSIDEEVYGYIFSSNVVGAFTVKFRFIPDVTLSTITDSVVLTVYIDPTIYDDVEIVDIPADVSFNVSESPAYIVWTFSYDGPCIVDVTLDGVWDDGRSYGASGANQTFTYVVDTSVVGTYELIFMVDPDGTDNPIVSDTVMVTIIDSIETTTTTTEEPLPEPEPDYMLLAIGVAAVVIVGFVMLKKRGEY